MWWSSPNYFSQLELLVCWTAIHQQTALIMIKLPSPLAYQDGQPIRDTGVFLVRLVMWKTEQEKVMSFHYSLQNQRYHCSVIQAELAILHFTSWSRGHNVATMKRHFSIQLSANFSEPNMRTQTIIINTFLLRDARFATDLASSYFFLLYTSGVLIRIKVNHPTVSYSTDYEISLGKGCLWWPSPSGKLSTWWMSRSQEDNMEFVLDFNWSNEWHCSARQSGQLQFINQDCYGI